MRTAFLVSPLYLNLILAFSCNPAGKPLIKNLNNNEITVAGHGGSGFKSWVNNLPMNSFESIRQAVEENNADGVEMDVQLSADSVLILFHDHVLDKSTDCKGLINEHSEKELTGCLYSSAGSREFQVASLEKVMQYFSQNPFQPLLTFDLKLHPAESIDKSEYLKQFARSISEMANNFCYTDKVLIESTSKEMLIELKSINPEFKLFIYPADFESGLATAKELNLFGITIRNNLITKEQVELAHQSGLRVAIWGTKSKKSNREAVLKNPDYIQTDDIGNLTSLLN